MRKVRKLRHWKQRYDKNAAFIWRKPVLWQGDQVEPGDAIPEELSDNKAKLRRFWEAGIIELAEFEEPNVVTGRVEPEPTPDPEPQGGDGDVPTGPEQLVTKETDRKWHVEGRDEVFKSKTKALEAAEAVIAERKVTETADEAGMSQTEQPDVEAETTEQDDAWLEGDKTED